MTRLVLGKFADGVGASVDNPKPNAGETTMTRWFVTRQGKLEGPFTLEELQDKVKAGDLKPADLVCPEGKTPTVASRVPGLFDKPMPAPPEADSVQKEKAGPLLTPNFDASKAQPKEADSPAPEKLVVPDRAPPTTWTLPKPILFALCGAFGGIFAAILLGEGLWWVLKPPYAQHTRIATPESMKVYV